MSRPKRPAMTASSATKDARISVVMVSYQTGPALLKSIRAVQDDPDIHELIIVDNGNAAADRAAFYAAAAKTNTVRILQGQGNVGFARGCNYGAAMATGAYLFFLNPDALIERGAARKLVDAGANAKTPWLAGGLLVDVDGHEQRGSRRGALTLRSALISFTPFHRRLGLRSIHRENEQLPKAPVPMPTISGASVLTDRASFDVVGGFDPGYFLHVEDIALCRSVRNAGGAVIFVPDARAMHYGSTSNVSFGRVEWFKLRGFLRYFWTAGPGLGVKIKTILSAPLFALAIGARVVLLSLSGSKDD